MKLTVIVTLKDGGTVANEVNRTAKIEVADDVLSVNYPDGTAQIVIGWRKLDFIYGEPSTKEEHEQQDHGTGADDL